MHVICQNVSHQYATKRAPIAALKDIDLSVQQNEFVSLIGPSGCGKTTLIKIIAGLITPSSGNVEFGRTSHPRQPNSAMVFQDQGLFPWMTVVENIMIGSNNVSRQRKEQEKRASIFIKQFGLAGFERNYPHQLSGGMRQRVALARAFISDTHLFLLDEPFGSLDPQIKLVLQEELLQIWREHKRTVIYITHDIEEAIRLSDRIVVMSGRPGTIQSIVSVPLKRPRNLLSPNEEIADLKWHIWKMLESDVRNRLRLSEDS